MRRDCAVTAYSVESTSVVAAGGDHTAGLKSDGIAVAARTNCDSQPYLGCTLINWIATAGLTNVLPQRIN